jgi:hypothetical protein
MAKAEKVQETVVRREKVNRYQLTLTEGETDFLQAVLAMIGGDPRRSPRKYEARIAQALSAATGMGYMQTDAYPLSYGRLIFSDYPDKAIPGVPSQLADSLSYLNRRYPNGSDLYATPERR